MLGWQKPAELVTREKVNAFQEMFLDAQSLYTDEKGVATHFSDADFE